MHAKFEVIFGKDISYAARAEVTVVSWSNEKLLDGSQPAAT
jgi:hypothetical protein